MMRLRNQRQIHVFCGVKIRPALRKLSALIILLSVSLAALAQPGRINWDEPNPWVDSVYASLTPDERIAQLIMVAAWSNKDSSHIRDIECHIRELKIGGLIFFKGTPVKQALLTNYYQSVSKVPLLIGIDGEWGLSMRLDSVLTFPRQMVLGSSGSEELAFQMGESIGRQCKRMGIHINFAPDADVNNNPNNPVINDRSFGENKFLVAKLASQYAKGIQQQHVLACAKHFPGHGDTESDSHYSLPVVKGDRRRLDSLELYPFKELIANDVYSVMSAHLDVPALDSTNTASSLSRPVITGLLKNEMGFKGIVVTDALNMKGVAGRYSSGEISARAVLAGNDLLEFVEDVTQSINTIRLYLDSGWISAAQVEKSCKKILLAKYWAGLADYHPISTDHLVEDLNCCDNELMVKKIIRQGIVVAKNEEKMIPFQNPELYRTAVVSVGSGQFTAFQEMCTHYINADYYSIDKTESQVMFDTLYAQLQPYNMLIISLQNTSRYVSKKLGLTPLEIDFINRITPGRRNIFVCNGNPYILGSFNSLKNVIVSYEDLELNNQLAAEVLFGAEKATGKLPVTVNTQYPLGNGEQTASASRITYVMPEEAGLDAAPLSMIDTIVNDAIRKGATPGCQVFVAKAGKVIYSKSFGSHYYDGIVPVKDYHLYDVASLTKILATTLAVMHLYDEHKIRPEDHLGTFLPWLKGTNKENLTVHDVMLHQAGLVPFIPFYKQTLVDSRPSPVIYAEEPDSDFCIPVAQSLYMNRHYEDFIWQRIANSELKTPGEYVYSDLGFMLLRKVVEQLGQTDFETYLQTNIYKPLNLGSMRFNPLGKVNTDWLVPTEYDTVFRMQQLCGTVHDPAAAMLGGVSGHAGLFASASDVGVIMQMLLNGGTYGGKRVLKESTVHLFTRKQVKTNRRGLGFDKPETDPKKPSPTGHGASPLAFGHTGFTGTCAWADPKNEIVYVFLSNRVNPSADNKKLVDMNVRTRIMDVVYEAVKNSK